MGYMFLESIYKERLITSRSECYLFTHLGLMLSPGSNDIYPSNKHPLLHTHALCRLASVPGTSYPRPTIQDSHQA